MGEVEHLRADGEERQREFACLKEMFAPRHV
jgi:hypothetical protein